MPKVPADVPLAALNTSIIAPGEGTPFRLRMTLHVGIAQADAGGASFKLQVAQRGADNLCDTSFSGETYSDLSQNSGAIRFYDNPKAIDTQSICLER